MRQRTSLTAIVLLVAMVVSQEFGPLLSAQNSVPTAQQLDQLLAPIALYPDSLLAQITTASTNPQEILDVDNWLQQNQGLTGSALTDAAEKAGFDPAFIALTNFPQVLDMMANNIDDYAAIGQAFSADQGAVSASIQRLRAQAYAAGSLRSNSQLQVEVQQPASQPIYVIQPVNPQVVYVPVYNPTVVYVAPTTSTVVATSLITFGAGIAIGALLVGNQPWGWGGWGWGWGTGRCYYNHTVFVAWGNPYRPPNVWYRPRPVLYTSRPGYGGNWHYRPPNYRPPYRLVYHPGNRPPWGPNNRPGYKPPATRPPGGSRPPAKPSNPGRPTHPIAKPGTSRPPGTGKPPSTSRPPSSSKPPGTSKPPSTDRPAKPPGTGTTKPPATNRPPGNGTNRPPSAETPASKPKPTPPSGTKPQTRPSTPNQSPANQSPGTRPAAQPKPAPAAKSQDQNKPPSRQKPAAKPQAQPRN
jgi:hypothetical protein